MLNELTNGDTAASAAISFRTLGGEQLIPLARVSNERAPLVMVAPALGVRAGYYKLLIEGLNAAGFHAAAIDYPGHGDSSVRASRKNDWGYLALVDHLRAARLALTAALPEATPYWLGHSLGGQLALMESGAAAEAVRGVLLVASGSPWWRAWPGTSSLRVAAATAFIGTLSRVWGHYPGERVGFGGREASTLMRQWAKLGLTGKYRFDNFDGEGLLAQCRVPVLAVRLYGDPYAPERAVEHTLKKIASPTIVRALWDKDLPTGNVHNRWPRRPQFAVEQVRRFIEDDVVLAAAQ